MTVGFRTYGLRVKSVGFRVQGFEGCRVWGAGLGARGFEFRVYGIGFRAYGLDARRERDRIVML